MQENPEDKQPEITPDSTAEVPAVSDKEGTSEIPELIITRTGEVPKVSSTSEVPAASDAERTVAEVGEIESNPAAAVGVVGGG